MSDYLEKIKPHYIGYQELHVHTTGSFRDAANTVQDVFDAAEELGRNAVAITDHGNWTRLFEALKERTKREKSILKAELISENVSNEDIDSVLKVIGPFDSVRNPTSKMLSFIEKYEDAFVKTAQKSIQFVPGVEMYEGEPTDGDAHHYHIIFYAKDWEGAKVLFALCNLAQLNKYNDMPRCTIETMRFFLGDGSRGHDHVIATSACMGGHIPSILLKPLQIIEERQKLEQKKSKLTVISEDVLENAEKKIADMETELAKNKEELKLAKKLVNKNFTTALNRAKAKLDKATAKRSNGQLTFGQTDGGAERVYCDALAAYEQLTKESALADSYRDRIPQMESDIASLKQAIKDAKASFKDLCKQNAPVQKLQEKIDVLSEEENALGDVYEEAKQLALEYDKILGHGNFFIELQDHGIFAEKMIRDKLIRISRETGIPLTVANDVHYKTPAMKRKRDIIAALRFPDMHVSDIADRVGNDQLWFKPNDAMMELFKDVPDAVENTNRIAEMCNVYYKKEMHLPEFVDEKWHLSPDDYLRKISEEGISRRYPEFDSWTEEKQNEFRKRLDYELGIIRQMGYSSYISIVEDFISWTKKHYSSESVGAGRGSGAGSLVCYLTGITNIDPLRYNLIFERFLNPERVSMPDIDTDFAPSVRDKVVDYVSERYSCKEEYWVRELSGTVCGIYTEGVLAAKSAIRQVARVTNVPLSVSDKIAKLIPAKLKTTLKSALEDEARLKTLYETDDQVRKLYDDAMLVEGTPIQTGVHAAGVIIADKPVSEYAPLFWNEKKNVWVIQYDMIACEGDLGLLKMDFLGLRNLDIIMKAKAFIRQRTGKTIDFFQLTKADDADVISNIYGAGDTDGVFQFESGGMKKTLASFIPKTIDDVILLNAAYRPGPMQYIPDVTDVKFGKKKASYAVPEMASILDSTYGSPIYQEQIQQIFHEIAGFSLGQADIIRRAMSKKHLDELQAAKGKFAEGFKARGASDESIEQFWNQLLEFAKYAFNKSHAAAYSVVSYYTAWLKYHYRVEYMAALMAFATREDIPLYVKDLRNYKIALLPPDINKSVSLTSPVKAGNAIRFGLNGIKDIGDSAQRLIAERKARGPFTDFNQFMIRCAIAGIDKSAIIALINCGACDEVLPDSANRLEASANVPDYLKACRDAIKVCLKNHPDPMLEPKKDEQDADLFYYLSSEKFTLPAGVQSQDYDPDERLRLEKEYTGYYISGDPIAKHETLMKRFTETQISSISEPAQNIELAGLVSDFKQLNQKKDGKPMCKFTLEDQTEEIDVVCFARAYERLTGQFSDGNIVYVKGRVDVECDDEGNVISRQLIVSAGKRIA